MFAKTKCSEKENLWDRTEKNESGPRNGKMLYFELIWKINGK